MTIIWIIWEFSNIGGTGHCRPAGAMDQSTDLSASILETLPVDLTTLILDLLPAEDRACLSTVCKTYAYISQQNWRSFTLHKSRKICDALNWIQGVAIKRGERVQALKIQCADRYEPKLRGDSCRIAKNNQLQRASCKAGLAEHHCVKDHHVNHVQYVQWS